MRLSFVIFIFSFLLSSCLSDLRPKTLEADVSSKEAADLLLKASYQHGYKFWVQNPNYSCVIQDNYYGIIGKIANPLKGNVALFNASFNIEKREGVLAFTDEEKIETKWIYKNGMPFLNDETSIPKGRKAKEIKFWVPTYQYFIEFPYKIVEADAIEFIGREELNGEMCRKIIASWNTVEPQKEIDQYVVWINEKDVIVRLDYTIREQFGFLAGYAVVEEYSKFNNYDVPKRISVYRDEKLKNKFHEMNFHSFK